MYIYYKYKDKKKLLYIVHKLKCICQDKSWLTMTLV